MTLNLLSVKSKFQIACDELYPSFRIDDNNDGVIKLLMYYMARDERFETAVAESDIAWGLKYDLNKGICLYGPCGTGKTLLMKVIQRTIYYLNCTNLNFKLLSMRQMCMDYQDMGTEMIRRPERKHWFVDEFGLVKPDNPRERVSSYGNKILLGDELIGFRDDLFVEGWLTHLTTNLDENEMEYYYSERTVSRLKGMMNFIPLNGTDRRPVSKAKPVYVIPFHEEKRNVIKIEQDWWGTILKQFKDYKAGIAVDFHLPLHQIKSFETRKVLVLTQEEKNDYYAMAKKLILSRNDINAPQKIVARDLEQFKDILSLEKAIISGTENQYQKNQIGGLAVIFAFRDFYDTKTVEEFEVIIQSVTNILK